LTNYTGGWGYSNETRDYFEQVLLALRGMWSNTTLLKTPLLVPVGDVLYALNQKMKAGQVPDLTNIVQVYADAIHFNNTGAYVVGCTYYSTLFKENPFGLPPEYYGLTNVAFLVSCRRPSGRRLPRIRTRVWRCRNRRRHPARR
jgi:hypothetical protein